MTIDKAMVEQWVNNGGLNVKEVKKMKNGIDVSSHQGKINWKLASREIDFAILRCGYGNNYTHQDDSMFEYNYIECKKYNIPIGLYLYSYAADTSMAKSEAEHVIRLLKNKTFDLPIFYDIEDKTQEKLSKNTLYKIFETFFNYLSLCGYKVGLYSSKYWLTSILPTQEIRKLTNLIWVAQYSNKCTYKGKYIMWQSSSTKKIPGIKGNVDYNYLYDSTFIENDYQKTDNVIYYTVKSGDNLTKIARKYNTTVKAILELNPTIKNPNLIYVDEIIKVKGGV